MQGRLSTIHANAPYDYSQLAIDKRGDENFPVASLLLPKKIRKDVISFYYFARHSDNIADDNAIPPQERLDLLNAISLSVAGNQSNMPEWAKPYRELLRQGKLDSRHGRALLDAFMQDVEKSRYASWEELIDYCMRSAAPVGRAVLEIGEEYYADITASDKICCVLQILNHLQDIKEDYQERDRIYFPMNGLIDNDLSAEKASPELRAMIDEVLDRVDVMLKEAHSLFSTVKSFRLRMEIATIWHIAQKLSKSLRHKDPIASKVKLSKFDYVKVFIHGLKTAISSSFNTHTITQMNMRAKSSFLRSLLKMEKSKQEAMFALYAFCHEVDDAVDEAESLQQAQNNIAFWQKEVDALFSKKISDYPTHPITRALLPQIHRYNLKKEYFDSIIAGMRMDIEGMVKPDVKRLEEYCYNVASCVGHLSVNIFGEDNEVGHNVADNLGKALQLINIIRDIYEDAQKGRIYLPMDLLKSYDLADISPQDIATDLEKYNVTLSQISCELAQRAEYYLIKAKENISEENKDNMLPALEMAKIYEIYLNKIRSDNFSLTTQKIRLSVWDKIKIVLGF